MKHPGMSVVDQWLEFLDSSVEEVVFLPNTYLETPGDEPMKGFPRISGKLYCRRGDYIPVSANARQSPDEVSSEEGVSPMGQTWSFTPAPPHRRRCRYCCVCGELVEVSAVFRTIGLKDRYSQD